MARTVPYGPLTIARRKTHMASITSPSETGPDLIGVATPT
jgi:hypothetical protein